MIVVKVDGEKYTINNDFSVSEGKYKEFLQNCIEMIRFNYSVSKGFFEPYLYINLGEFKLIEPISCDYTPPPDDPNIKY